MSTTLIIVLVLLTAPACSVLLFLDWRITLPMLFINYLCQMFFLAQQKFVLPDLTLGDLSFSSLIFVKLVTGITVTLILGITALTFSHDYGLEDLDEFSLAELRRAA